MSWYLSKIVFRIVVGDGDHTPQFDEQLRLIAACNEGQAFEKAQELGRREEDSFLNKRQELVRWEFINVVELYKMTELIDGAEMYSKIEEHEDGDRHLAMINSKAAFLKESTTHKILQLF